MRFNKITKSIFKDIITIIKKINNVSIEDFKTKKFMVYFTRWQASAWIMMPFMVLFEYLGLSLWLNLLIGQAIGSFIFFEIDKFILVDYDKDSKDSND